MTQPKDDSSSAENTPVVMYGTTYSSDDDGLPVELSDEFESTAKPIVFPSCSTGIMKSDSKSPTLESSADDQENRISNIISITDYNVTLDQMSIRDILLITLPETEEEDGDELASQLARLDTMHPIQREWTRQHTIIRVMSLLGHNSIACNNAESMDIGNISVRQSVTRNYEGTKTKNYLSKIKFYRGFAKHTVYPVDYAKVKRQAKPCTLVKGTELFFHGFADYDHLPINNFFKRTTAVVFAVSKHPAEWRRIVLQEEMVFYNDNKHFFTPGSYEPECCDQLELLMKWAKPLEAGFSTGAPKLPKVELSHLSRFTRACVTCLLAQLPTSGGDEFLRDVNLFTLMSCQVELQDILSTWLPVLLIGDYKTIISREFDVSEIEALEARASEIEQTQHFGDAPDVNYNSNAIKKLTTTVTMELKPSSTIDLVQQLMLFRNSS